MWNCITKDTTISKTMLRRNIVQNKEAWSEYQYVSRTSRGRRNISSDRSWCLGVAEPTRITRCLLTPNSLTVSLIPRDAGTRVHCGITHDSDASLNDEGSIQKLWAALLKIWASGTMREYKHSASNVCVMFQEGAKHLTFAVVRVSFSSQSILRLLKLKKKTLMTSIRFGRCKQSK